MVSELCEWVILLVCKIYVFYQVLWDNYKFIHSISIAWNCCGQKLPDFRQRGKISAKNDRKWASWALPKLGWFFCWPGLLWIWWDGIKYLPSNTHFLHISILFGNFRYPNNGIYWWVTMSSMAKESKGVNRSILLNTHYLLNVYILTHICICTYKITQTLSVYCLPVQQVRTQAKIIINCYLCN